VRLLLDSGALLSQRDGVGRTALMWAATGDNARAVELLLEVVKVLLKYHADPAVRDTDGDTARDSATRNRNVDVVQLLAN
jgi:ankyrin repeat protein